MSHVPRSERAPFAANRLAETGTFDRVLEAQADQPRAHRRPRLAEGDIAQDTAETYNEEARSVALAHRAVVLAYL